MRKTTSTNYENQQQLEEYCDAAYALHCISGRWKLSLLVQLQQSDLRFSELRQALPLITERILSLQLKELETAGLISKQTGTTAGKNGAMAYTLSPGGKALAPVIKALANWGGAYKPLPAMV